MGEERMRADAAMVARGLAGSREKARALIEAGLAVVNGRRIEKPSQRVGDGDDIEVLGSVNRYVGRGGLKLEKALKVFGVDPSGKICMDIGASTGGFTDVLLQNGARHVYAIDVGSGQLDPSLAADARVTNLEHVNARALTPGMFPQAPVLAVMDVSFISIRLILPSALPILGGEGRMISLIKPQFEAGRAWIGKHGVVSKPAAHLEVLRNLTTFLPTLGWRIQGLDFSPIAGGSGNLEFLADMVSEARCGHAVDDAEIERVVRLAHSSVPLKQV